MRIGDAGVAPLTRKQSWPGRTMENCNLHYESTFQLIICMEHQYCVAYESLDRHLRDQHKVKGHRLHTALAEASTLEVRDSRTFRSSFNGPFISYFSIQTGFLCDVSECNGEGDVVTTFYQQLSRHLSKIHDIANTKGKTKLKATDFKRVCVQSLLGRQKFSPFVVVPVVTATADNSLNSESNSVAPQEVVSNDELSDNEITAAIAEEYGLNQKKWIASHNRLSANTELYITQTPPWLHTTGISSWIGSLNMEKTDLWILLQAKPNGM